MRDAALRSIILSQVAVIPLNDAVLQATDCLLLDAATAQFHLGVMFDNGQGVAQDFAEAVRLYSLAAAQGHAYAQLSLGLMFENGEGVAQDTAEAIRWYRLAAEQGHAGA